ncbi:MAG TPA: hypothetical protein VIL79_00235 [Thermoleophilia bacterium]|jgi:uncharacterized membrane protein YjgN (DUF898 family)
MGTIATSQPLGRETLDIGLVFKQGWRLFVKDIGPLIVGALIVAVLSIVSLGILAGPLAAGLYGTVVKRVRDGQQPEVGDVFGQMSRFWAFFAAALVLGILIGLASVTVIGGILLATIWLYVFPLMVDRGLGLGEAMSASYRMVKEAGFWEHLALVIVFAVIASLANGVLVILATPFLVAAVAAGYYVAAGKGDELERAAA